MEKMIYTPLTATPLNKSGKYREVLPQNPDLARYIRCFWGSEKPYINWEDRNQNDKRQKDKKQEECDRGTIVTPDTCVDIIFQIDYTENRITGRFCGINDASFFTHNEVEKGHIISTFAIRFYGWGAYAFSEDSLKGTLNCFHEAENLFRWLDRIMRQQLFEKCSLAERVNTAEELLLQRLAKKVRQNTVVDHAVQEMISHRGMLGTVELSRKCFISSRQLERLFHEYIGITPKKLGNLVRYQFLWNDIFRNPEFHILDGVYKYGYTDQSHLLREFKRYHTMDIQTARQYAYHVGNIQYMPGE